MIDLQARNANGVTNSGAHLGGGGDSGGGKPNFFVFQNKMNSRPSLHNYNQQVNGFGNTNRTARNSGSAYKY